MKMDTPKEPPPSIDLRGEHALRGCVPGEKVRVIVEGVVTEVVARPQKSEYGDQYRTEIQISKVSKEYVDNGPKNGRRKAAPNPYGKSR